MKTNLWIAAICLLCMGSCAKSDTPAPEPNPTPTPEQPVEIALKGEVSTSVTAQSSASAQLPPDTRTVINGIGTKLDVAFARLDQQAGGGWDEDYTAVGTALNASLETDGKITFAPKQYYLSRNTDNSTKMVGWYPRGTYSNGVATFSISDGITDIMTTQELVGSKSAKFEAFTFSHMLTRLDVKAYAETQDAANVWGTINEGGIVIKDQVNACTLTLPSTFAFSEEPEDKADLTLPAKQVADDSQITYPLTIPALETDKATDADPCGYAMIKPVDNGSSVTLTVTTSLGGTYEVNVPAPEGGFTAGHAYNVYLKFTATAIEPTATIAAWLPGDDVEVEM